MKRFSLVFVLAAFGLLVGAGSALAAHARPNGASPLNFRLVPHFLQCTGSTPAGMTHGPPLAVPSCSPPVQASDFLTFNAPERAAPYFSAPDGTGLVALKVACLVPGTTTELTGPDPNPPCAAPGDQVDVRVTITTTGVRCVSVSGGCAAAGGTYSGKILVSWTLRLTDHYNARIPNPPGADCSDALECVATEIDLPFDVGAQCSSGACNYVTSADLTVPGVAQELKRAVWGVSPIEVQDAGANGDLAGGSACPPTCAQDGVDHNFALTQGLFVP